MRSPYPSGFSLIETLVVLAIGGMALTVIFSIGLKAGDSGFSLGRKAISVSDLDIANNDIRTLIQSFELRPQQSYTLSSDVPLTGSATTLDGQVIVGRSTGCAPRGWAGRARLIIQNTDEGQALVCNMGTETQPLAKWAAGTKGSFSYSFDGENWYDHIPERPQLDPELLIEPSSTLWIRFTDGGKMTIIDRVTSGRSETWRRLDGQL